MAGHDLQTVKVLALSRPADGRKKHINQEEQKNSAVAAGPVQGIPSLDQSELLAIEVDYRVDM